ncbi:MAG TPA: extracellular solute-binding protein [Jatrophihabitans sp.]|jgi:sulfate transport system substrate-binding protein|nr:extracellular solute-binding protein [Jatrophihabitans sp.]
MTTSLLRTRRFAAVAAATIAAVVGVSACSSSSSAKSIRLVAYSVPQPAYDALGTAFAKTSAGKGVSVKGSYGPSGSQSKAVLAGQQADYVAFSVEPDLTKLVPSKVAPDWNSGPTKGLVSDSVVVIVVRKGNPLHITGWDDLTKPGVEIVTPVPSSSGSAKWNILAAYEHVIAEGGTPAAASAYLKSFFAHVKSRASSGSQATQQFLSGTGNVLISYEDEAIAARQAGKPVDYIVPDQTVLIENPAAVTKGAPQVAKDFLSFVESEQGQEIFASKGFRPVLPGTKVGTVEGANDPSNPFPSVKKLITVASLGGWTKVNDEFFGDNGISTKLEGSTS